MELTIHAYGYAYTIFNTLTAIAMFRNSTLYPAVINTVALMVGVFYAWKMAASRAEGEWRQYLMKIGGMVLLINALLLPKTTMYIKDHVDKHFVKVDNIPLAFALPIGMVEEMGHLMTIGFEQAFSTVGGRSAFNYYNHGTVFGARLAKEVMKVRVRNPEYIANMKNFIERCVILPAMIGEQFTKEELVSTKNMWKLVSENAGTLTRTDMVINGKRWSPAPTCKEAVKFFEKKMEDSMSWDITGISIKLPGRGKKTNFNSSHKELNKALTGHILALYKDESSVKEILEHSMMINSLNQYRAANYPGAKAALQYEAGGLISGALAEKILTGLLAVFKNIIYGSFIFMFPLMLLAGGMGKYRNWITICLSLQLWPPLFAMLNMLMDVSYEPAKIVSYSVWATTYKRFDSMASMAANLTLMIPFLAVYITRMGEGGFLHLAGSIMATASSAATSASAEQASGGRSYDNSSIGNISRDNTNANKYDTNQQFFHGVNSGINPDGSTHRTNPDNTEITIGGAGSTESVLKTKYNSTDSTSASMSESIRDEQQAVASESAALNKVREESVSQDVEISKAIAEHYRSENGYSFDQSTELGQKLAKIYSEEDQLAQNAEYRWGQNLEAHLKADVTLGGKIARLFGVDVGGGVSASAENANNQVDQESLGFSNNTNIDDDKALNNRTSKTENFSQGVAIDENLLNRRHESYNQSKRLEESITAHKDNIQAWSKSLDYHNSHGNEVSQDMTQDVINKMQNDYGISNNAATREANEGGYLARKVFKELGQANAQEIFEKIKQGKIEVMDSNDIKDFTRQHQDEINQTPGKNLDVKSFEEVKGNIINSGNNLQNKHDNNVSAIDVEYQKELASLKEKHEAKQNLIAEHEKNRALFKELGIGRQDSLGVTPSLQKQDIDIITNEDGSIQTARGLNIKHVKQPHKNIKQD